MGKCKKDVTLANNSIGVMSIDANNIGSGNGLVPSGNKP